MGSKGLENLISKDSTWEGKEILYPTAKITIGLCSVAAMSYACFEISVIYGSLLFGYGLAKLVK